MRHPADAGKLAIQNQMCRQIGRRLQCALDDAPVQIDDHDVGPFHGFVGHAARLDRNHPLLAVDAAGVAPGVEHQPAANQLEVCLEHLFAQSFQFHLAVLTSAAVRRSSGRTSPNDIAGAPGCPKPK